MKMFVKVGFVVVVAIALVFSFHPTSSHAASAPSLSYVGVSAITSDGNNWVWTNVPKYALSTSTVMKGQSIALAIEVLGTERSGSLRIYHNGVDVTTQASNPIPDEYLYSNNQLVGRLVYFEFPTSVLKNGDDEVGSFVVTANDYYTNNYYSQGFNFPIDDTVN